jgi:hypothetical protein
LDASLDLGSIMSGSRCVGDPCLFNSLLFQVCWNLQVSRRYIYLHSDFVFLSISVSVTMFDILCSKEHLCLMLCSGGCWHVVLVLCWRLIHSLCFKPLLIFVDAPTLYPFFCNLVSRPYTCSLGCTRGKWLYC